MNAVNEFPTFLSLHRPQLETSSIPRHFWERLHEILNQNIFDAGDTFSLLQVEYEGEHEAGDPLWTVVVSAPSGVSAADSNQIYLIDHAWTYRVNMARGQLQKTPGLLQRMAALMDLEIEGKTAEESIDQVLDEMWKFNQTYSIGNPSASAEDKLPIWYIMDEFGSRIQHSDDPSFRTVPFFYMPEQVAYSLLFPIRDVGEGGEVTRDFIEGPEKETMVRKALLLPWKQENFTDIDFAQEEDPELFKSYCQNETQPDMEMEFPDVSGDRKLKVFAVYKYIQEYLRHPRFEIVEKEEEADILWYGTHFKGFREFSECTPHKFVNQFPCECVLTVKDLLSIVCRRKLRDKRQYSPDTLEAYPSWLPTTYNLKRELPKFVSYYQKREEMGLDNHWICKPWNLARGLDHHITRNLNYIVRLPFTGPKIVQKYIEDPVLFERVEIGKVKFDIRYILLLRSVKPLKLYAYKRFWLRFANLAFELQNLDEYEKHFTVMNYTDASLKQMFCHHFISDFESQYPNHKWNTMETKIFTMLKEVFECAASREAPCGIGHNPQSRAMYAVDLMLAWKEEDGMKVMQPKLLEINWAPDCQRACEYYPEFFDDVFSVLFLDEVNGKNVEEL